MYSRTQSRGWIPYNLDKQKNNCLPKPMQRVRKNPQTRRPRKTAATKKIKPRMAISQMLGAPAGVSQDLQQFTNFSAGRNGGIRMHSCVAIYQVQKTTTNANGSALDGPGLQVVSAQLNLTDPKGYDTSGNVTSVEYVSPVYDLIASSFVRYRINRLVFHYEPQASATDSQRLVFAFANDPTHPIIWDPTFPTEAGLLSLSDSVAFMPWRSWSMDVTSRVTKDRLYTYVEPTLVDVTVARFSDFGSIGCRTTGTGSNQIGGVLYMELDVELEEFCPISVTRPASLSHLTRRVERHQKKQTEEKKRMMETPSSSGATPCSDKCCQKEN